MDVSTGITSKDFYLNEKIINETGEIFHVGKGHGNRNNEFY